VSADEINKKNRKVAGGKEKRSREQASKILSAQTICSGKKQKRLRMMSSEGQGGPDRTFKNWVLTIQ